MPRITYKLRRKFRSPGAPMCDEVVKALGRAVRAKKPKARLLEEGIAVINGKEHTFHTVRIYSEES